ncbi:ImmA/IrrE family metallo-endopeptidase [Zhihengliuella halotolerans]|uniref:ImmA/IrrE family metallo-endopeptidase n=1 Tax=Zhihengliuella halotolerans TaxID=370736 RepID=UPI000C803205|nr:ImmA/IrrE family metallo-endopeptidase [Zhihengliuella halotolerans]
MHNTAIDPWTMLASEFAETDVIYMRLNGNMIACTDGETIWMDPRLNRRERRCALMHELVHIRMGHRGAQSPDIEWTVRQLAAEALVPMRPLKAILEIDRDLNGLCDHFDVTESVLRDRLGALLPTLS